jgi:ATPase subunit of ABC transporter with duplicated ATPase domains
MSDYAPKHSVETTTGLNYITATKVRAQIGNVARQRRLRYEYSPSIHSMEDGSTPYDDVLAAWDVRAKLERQLEELHSA